jgi:WhiB family redox-sensing transcriptional regulator
MNEPDWTESLCAQVGGDLWFPEKGESTKEAKAICRRCPLIAECLEWSLYIEDDHGVWGGTSREDRKKLRPARRLPGQHRTITQDAHGTYGVYQQHHRRHEKPCRDCAQARVEYDQRRATQKDAA